MMPNPSLNDDVQEIAFQIDPQDFIPSDNYDPYNLDLRNEVEIPQNQ